MSCCERIIQWRALIASYKQHRHEFDYFCLYTLFDTRENAIASELLYSPRQWVHPERGNMLDHFCVNRLPASIWRPKSSERVHAKKLTYLDEAQTFSSFLFTNNVTCRQDTAKDDNGELPHVLRLPLPPRGLIGIKLDGIKHCRQFALDCLVVLDDDNGDDCFWPRYLLQPCNCTFNWYGRTKAELYSVIPESCESLIWIFWFSDANCFVASLCERVQIRVLRRCIDFLDCYGERHLVDALKDKIALLSAPRVGEHHDVNKTAQDYQKAEAENIGDKSKKISIGETRDDRLAHLAWRDYPCSDLPENYFYHGWFGVSIFESID